MTEKPWSKHYKPGVPHEIDADAHSSIWAMSAAAIEKFGDAAAFSNFGADLSFNDIDRLSENFAAYLQNELGLKKGDRVAIMSPNIMAFPVTMFANIRAGLVQVNVNPLYTPRELEHQLNDADTDTIIIFSGSTPVLAEIIGNTPIKNVIVADLGDCGNAALPSPPVDERLKNVVRFTDALAAGEGLSFTPVEITGDDLLFLQYTGGTTGLSKGATLTHRNLVANIEQFSALAGDMIRDGEEVVITALPLYHIFALMVNCLSYFTKGGRNVLITNPRDMPGFVAELSNWKFSVITGVNTLFNGLLHTPGFAECDFSNLRLTGGGGTAIQEAISNKWREVTGQHITEGYGLSETSPVATFNVPGQDEFTATIGVPLASTDIVLRGDEGEDVAQGEPGELCIKGPQVMIGYWRQPDETAAVTTKDGYFCTGDVAILTDEGHFKIVDRKKDMILVSGFNVYPNEIEAVVANMDGVLEAACVGVPDERTDEAVKLFVVKMPDTDVGSEEITAFCRENLTAYKVPRQIAFIDELPKSPVGKILRRELRD
ncbi:MAG: AMP-binding protein [Rhodospirillaceae bacterium]|jgi:long-chain acyl-CoA synthetase|nr:AMP-binding protein [Rhodospirillaceae bacterium]MBT4690764.1 AMP-binding protein [Rhodospirillaceae bacterium]MBT5522948.1 AMP-binding protein [Rhodospirillaceae bacterium]MBT5880353.1 AMP-binding protein [Rhodospirillaceae bacterium]MBT6591036.1 AMP-binding protein [Rhodospirillaceae bacterium]